jgi:hypothetical protein
MGGPCSCTTETPRGGLRSRGAPPAHRHVGLCPHVGMPVRIAAWSGGADSGWSGGAESGMAGREAGPSALAECPVLELRQRVHGSVEVLKLALVIGLLIAVPRPDLGARPV